jgi:hypothetical protein
LSPITLFFSCAQTTLWAQALGNHPGCISFWCCWMVHPEESQWATPVEGPDSVPLPNLLLHRPCFFNFLSWYSFVFFITIFAVKYFKEKVHTTNIEMLTLCSIYFRCVSHSWDCLYLGMFP